MKLSYEKLQERNKIYKETIKNALRLIKEYEKQISILEKKLQKKSV